MSRSTKATLITIAISLMALGITNIAMIAGQLELRLAMRIVWLSCFSWALVWLCGALLAALAIGDRPDPPRQ